MKKFIPFIIILAFFSCKPVPEKIAILEPVVEKPAFDTQQSIAKALEAFLYYPDLPVADSFKPKRTLIIEEQNIQLQLSIALDKKSREHQMVTIVNAQNEGYSIPLFPNAYSNYWNFEFQGINAQEPACHTTFDKELHTALDYLQLDDTLRSVAFVIPAIYHNLLNGRTMDYRVDSLLLVSNFKNIAKGNRRCLDRLNKSIDSIFESMYDDFGMDHNVIWDEKNHRIYQLFFRGENKRYWERGERVLFSIKVFKADC